MFKKITAILLDAVLGLVSSSFLVLIFLSITSHLPYKHVRELQGQYPFDFLPTALIIIFSSVITAIILGLTKVIRFSPAKRIVIILSVTTISILTLFVLNSLSNALYGKYTESLNYIADTVVSQKTSGTIITNNNVGFDYIVINTGTGLKASDIPEDICSREIAELLEFQSFDSDTITFKAAKGNMIFETIRRNDSFYTKNFINIAKTGGTITFHIVSDKNKIILTKIE